MTGAPLPPPQPGRKRAKGLGATGCGLLIVGLVVFAGAMRLFWTRVDERRFPWGYPEGGRSVLVGTWVGTFTTGGGHRRALLLDMKLQPLNFGGQRGSGRGAWRNARSTNIEGMARLCGGAREQRFEFDGINLDKTASRFRLAFSPADSVPPDGFSPSHLRGRWDGQDAITLEVDVYLRRGVSAISGSDDPDTGRPATGALSRGNADVFRALCARR